MDNVLSYKGYRAEIDFSYQGNCFTGRILGINDNVTFNGKTVSELKTAFHDALNYYLNKCKKEGQKPDKEYKGSFNVRVGQSLHEDSVKASEELGISLNQFVMEAIKEKLYSLSAPVYKYSQQTFHTIYSGRSSPYVSDHFLSISWKVKTSSYVCGILISLSSNCSAIEISLLLIVSAKSFLMYSSVSFNDMVIGILMSI